MFVTWAPVLIESSFGRFVCSLPHLRAIGFAIIYRGLKPAGYFISGFAAEPFGARKSSEVDSREVTPRTAKPGSYRSDLCRAEQLRALDKVIASSPCWPLQILIGHLPLYPAICRLHQLRVLHSQLDELIADIRCETPPHPRYLASPPSVVVELAALLDVP